MSKARAALLYDESFLDHRTGVDHPERPARLEAVLRGLEKAGLLAALQRIDASPVDTEQLVLVHDPAYVDLVQMACKRDVAWLGSMDTGICAESERVARLAAGGVLNACDEVLAGRTDRAFCAVRPPGHHAEAGQAMGFCLFNNVAVAAAYAISRHGLHRVAIVDFDVHHGNGTQHTFEERADVFYISLHESPQFLYPGTGWISETGKGEGEGFTLNIPMPPGAGDDDYRGAFAEKVIPALDDFRPELLLVSAGFDAAAGESIAHLNLTPAAFAHMTVELAAVADRHCGGRLVSCLEGGYVKENLEACVPAHVKALMGS